jgi:hypothetical protein
VTEAEWLASTDPQQMFEYLRGKASDRKLRLYACACFRRTWSLAGGANLDKTRPAVETAELAADGIATAYELAEAYQKTVGFVGGEVAAPIAWDAAADATDFAFWRSEEECRAVAQWQVIRDIFGNPFRPVTLDPAWQSATVRALAQAIYDDRAFERMPILSDALEDAGCANADILNHCRQPGEHVRGCWVVDLVLGKS